MRTCPDCHAVVRDTANFCDNCGHPFGSAPPEPKAVSSAGAAPGTCSSCGYLNVPGEMFCQNCGVQLAPVASAPPPPPTPVSHASGPAIPPPLERCPVCGYRANPEDAFCQNCGAPLPSAGLSQPEPPAEQMAPPTIEDRPRIGIKLVVNTSQSVMVLDMDRNEWLVGRSDPVRGIFPEVDLGAQGGEKKGVSRRHARLVAQGDRRFISDLNSTNFTFLNGEKLQPGKLYPLKDGDDIRFGLLALRYYEELAE